MKRFALCVALLGIVTVAPAAPAPAVPPIPSMYHGARTVHLSGHAIAYFPPSVVPGTTTAPPILVVLHGSAQGPEEYISFFAKEADRRGIVLLAPSSRGATWDAITEVVQPGLHGRPSAHDIVYRGSPDGDRIEAAIRELARYVPVDRSKMVLAGMSDGATFALALGMLRTHDFAAVIAFSPGIPSQAIPPAVNRRVLVSHGREDEVLSFATTCRLILPALRREGAEVSFRAFEGEHGISPAVASEFLDETFGPVGLPGRQVIAGHPVKPSNAAAAEGSPCGGSKSFAE